MSIISGCRPVLTSVLGGLVRGSSKPVSMISSVAIKNMSFTQSSTRSLITSADETYAESLRRSEERCSEILSGIVTQNFAVHPFSKDITKENVKSVLRCYLAMSQAFPYIQAGAYKELILDCISRNINVPKSMEESFVVGAFLSFDETGGNYLLRTEGIQALPRILDTDIHFHASLLRKDIQSIFGEELSPDYSGTTSLYLKALLKDLGAKDSVSRSAAMVAFEMHAGQMIEALWNALTELYPEIDKESLEYFRVHVGGDDPQEEYHKMLTQKMVSSSVSLQQENAFLAEFTRCYAGNYDWCAAICKK